MIGSISFELKEESMMKLLYLIKDCIISLYPFLFIVVIISCTVPVLVRGKNALYMVNERKRRYKYILF